MKAPLTVDYADKRTGKEIHLPITIFKRPSNDKEYARTEKELDILIDEIRGNDKHPLALVMQIIGDNLEEYDDRSSPPIGSGLSEIEKVKYLMQSHQLLQRDLAEIFGGQANVSKFLHGERALSKNQIIGLKEKFKISADFFL